MAPGHVGGLGLGIQFSALIRRLTTVAPAEYAADISGVSTTTLQIGATIGVRAFGTLYLRLTSRDGVGPPRMPSRSPQPPSPR